MEPVNKPESFVESVLAEFGTVPRRGLIYLGLFGMISVAADLFFWSHQPDFQPADYVITLAMVVGWTIVIYAVSMLMISARLSAVGLGKFVATAFVAALPFLVSLGLLLIAGKTESGSGIAGAFILMLGSFIFLALLPGWPIMQATAARFVGPLEAFRSTKGFRWKLIGAWFALSAINRVIPETPTTDDFPTAFFLALVGGLIAMGSTMAGLSVAVVAWRRMQPRTETIGPW